MFFFASASVRAEEAGVAIRYVTKVSAGVVPRLEFEARVPMMQLLVRLQRDDGDKVNPGLLHWHARSEGFMNSTGVPEHAYKGEVAWGGDWRGGNTTTSSCRRRYPCDRQPRGQSTRPCIFLWLGVCC